ncbi:NAD(P)/FAD-dependent oxidoreductase [Marinobacter sp. F4216]|uniref:NAD(P)/FAD-dependent oxidoreductase n=1 Tax=Marinobacter sp. F4216 TaxID=2874281 RepID=UPI001CBD0A9A|nr:FAD-dependent oxidoreductase [Marinobacter sp. F4216]MBZ2168003.1 FAD-dependent oxidoreductase [Marinobacter sp. F4216]
MPNEKSVSLPVRRIAIVGSGLSGLTAAILLQQQGHKVVVFEKSRGPGGRLAAKRVPGGSADIGAQYFTARNPDFLPFLRHYAGDSTFAPWQGEFGFRSATGQWSPFPEEHRYVGTPRMTAITRALSHHLDVVPETRVKRFSRYGEQWTLYDIEDSSLGSFDQIILTAPPAQSRDLLVDSGLEAEAVMLEDYVAGIQPCWAVAAHFNETPCAHHQGMRVEHPVLYWLANNSSKPDRKDEGEWWVLHADPAWSQSHVDTPPEQVAALLVEAFRDLVGFAEDPGEVIAHRWLYARSACDAQPGHLWFDEQKIGLAGDWLRGGRVEGAFDSASQLVQAMPSGA